MPPHGAPIGCPGQTETLPKIPPLCISQLAESLLESPQGGRGWARHLELEQVTDPVHLPSLLRLSGERRGEEAARHAGDEGPPVHHSIT